MSLVLGVSVFWGLMLNTTLTNVYLLPFGLSLWKMNSIVSVPACFSNSGTDGQVHCKLSWSIPVHPSCLGLCIPILSLYFYSCCCLPLVSLWFFFFGVYASRVVCAYLCFYISLASNWKILGAFSKVVTWLTLLVLDMVLYLCGMVIYNLM